MLVPIAIRPYTYLPTCQTGCFWRNTYSYNSFKRFSSAPSVIGVSEWWSYIIGHYLKPRSRNVPQCCCIRRIRCKYIIRKKKYRFSITFRRVLPLQLAFVHVKMYFIVSTLSLCCCFR